MKFATRDWLFKNRERHRFNGFQRKHKEHHIDNMFVSDPDKE